MLKKFTADKIELKTFPGKEGDSFHQYRLYDTDGNKYFFWKGQSSKEFVKLLKKGCTVSANVTEKTYKDEKQLWLVIDESLKVTKGKSGTVANQEAPFRSEEKEYPKTEYNIQTDNNEVVHLLSEIKSLVLTILDKMVEKEEKAKKPKEEALPTIDVDDIPFDEPNTFSL